MSDKARRSRRRWSEEFKRRVVAEAMTPGASAAAIARRYDLNANLLFNWKRRYGESDRFLPVSKRLEKGRFVWPSPAQGKVSVTPAQLAMLLEGIDWRTPQRTWRPLTAG